MPSWRKCRALPARRVRLMDKKTLKALATLLVLTCCSALRAAPPEPCITTYQKVIPTLPQPVAPDSVFAVLTADQAGCILGAADSTGIGQLTQALRDAKTSAEKAAARQGVFKLVVSEFDGLPATPCEANTIACDAGRHVAKILELQRALDSGPVNPHNPLIDHDSWALQPATATVEISRINLNSLLTSECAPGALSAQCIAAVDFAARVIRAGHGMFELVQTYWQPIIDADTQFLTQRDKEWNSYMNDVSVQYPWELWVNGSIFQKITPEDERSKFPRAPTGKWVFLHPSPAFERTEGPTGGHSTQAAVLIEIAGYERWLWNNGAASNRWGASFVTSFVDATGSRAVGYGVLLKTPFKNASVGAIWRTGARGHQINLTINVDLAKLIKQYKDVDVKTFLGKTL
jgi:hypothetical protein